VARITPRFAFVAEAEVTGLLGGDERRRAHFRIEFARLVMWIRSIPFPLGEELRFHIRYGLQHVRIVR